MILLDTHAWIWWITDSNELSKTAKLHIAQSEEVGISVISCWEVAVLAAQTKDYF